MGRMADSSKDLKQGLHDVDEQTARRLFELTGDQRESLAKAKRDRESYLPPYATHDEDAVFEHPEDFSGDRELIRPAFERDVDRILNCAYYNRCMDKTQVFPFYKNDDLTRRSFHMQLVSHISRKIGSALRLNTQLIEAIALGHDLGHTPFGHGGERFLSREYHARTGRYFHHNVHSVRVLRTLAGRNISLQALDGILCHCGERAFLEYRPAKQGSFKTLDATIERCYIDPKESHTLRPCTLEGCVVRISDILAYLGKDRQDALTIGAITPEEYPVHSAIGQRNAEFIARATINIIKNSMGKPYLAMDQEVFDSIVALKDLNFKQIYSSDQAQHTLDEYIGPMFEMMYPRLLHDVESGDESSYIFRHHINAWMLRDRPDYRKQNPNDIVVDYIASMTDDYFIDLFNVLFPEQAVSREQLFVPYFR